MKHLDIHNMNNEELIHLISKNLSEETTMNVVDVAPQSFGLAKELIAETLSKLDLNRYQSTRNYINGKVTRLSAYIRHGLIDIKSLYEFSQTLDGPDKFIQELCWREFFAAYAHRYPQSLWHSVESYKTGYFEDDYASDLPHDIKDCNTGQACIDQMIEELYQTGYLHNHCRMYIASYVVHFRKVKWQVGAQWFLRYLIDGDVASNNLSWQWVASTFASKPYIFNLDNVAKFCGDAYDTSPEHNHELNFTYEELNERLFI